MLLSSESWTKLLILCNCSFIVSIITCILLIWFILSYLYNIGVQYCSVSTRNSTTNHIKSIQFYSTQCETNNLHSCLYLRRSWCIRIMCWNLWILETTENDHIFGNVNKRISLIPLFRTFLF